MQGRSPCLLLLRTGSLCGAGCHISAPGPRTFTRRAHCSLAKRPCPAAILPYFADPGIAGGLAGRREGHLRPPPSPRHGPVGWGFPPTSQCLAGSSASRTGLPSPPTPLPAAGGDVPSGCGALTPAGCCVRGGSMQRPPPAPPPPTHLYPPLTLACCRAASALSAVCLLRADCRARCPWCPAWSRQVTWTSRALLHAAGQGGPGPSGTG